MNYDINQPTKIDKKTIQIGNNSNIIVNEYRKRGTCFYEVIFNNNGSEKFIGRYPRNNNLFEVEYLNGKILVFEEQYIESEKSVMPTNVYDLYDILDDCYYTETQEQAIKLFSNDMNTNFLINKDQLTIRNDIEKKKEIGLR